MKFGKEYASQMVPELQEASMNYDNLKTLLKEVQRIKQRNKQNAVSKQSNDTLPSLQWSSTGTEQQPH